MKRLAILLFGILIVLMNSCSSAPHQKALNESRLLKRAEKIHKKALSVDSHVDTPMWFTRPGIDLSMRHDPYQDRIKFDIPRMEEGGLDGVFFAVFVDQQERSTEGNQMALAHAQRTLDSIYANLSRFHDKIELALTPDDLKRIAGTGKRAIFLGMENGYPLGNDIALVDSFYTAGIRYITLCHSFNNDICDSSTDSAEFHGISEFGAQVIERMNALGIMVDMSHASDESFYQAVKLSKAPIIASHSCARALCDNPRNMTDDMLLKLKENGGVIQMCILSRYVKPRESYPERDSALYAVIIKHGNYYSLDDPAKEAFLEDWFQVDKDYPPILATVSDMVNHIDHIVEVAGIDHVGIGTDFDGGGALADCFDVSEMQNITIELVRRGYTSKEIKKIWSGNLMRVLDEVAQLATAY